MSSDKEILKLIPTIQSTELLGRIRKRRRKPMKNAVDIIVGTSLIKEESDFINLL